MLHAAKILTRSFLLALFAAVPFSVFRTHVQSHTIENVKSKESDTIEYEFQRRLLICYEKVKVVNLNKIQRSVGLDMLLLGPWRRPLLPLLATDT